MNTPVKSPYTPGRIAKHVIGREEQLRSIKRDLVFMHAAPELLGRIEAFVGPRGVGKTSFLREVQHQAEKLNFATLWITAGDGSFLGSLVAAVEDVSKDWRDEAKNFLRQVLDSLTVSIAGVEVTGKGLGASQDQKTGLGRHLQNFLMAAGEQTIAEGKAGLILLVDEVQEADAEGLRALAYAWQHMQSEANELPMATYCTGLSHTQDVVTDAVSFGERFRYTSLSNLTAVAAAKAFTEPASALGVEWGREALDLAQENTEGYPYFIQLLADYIWQAADYPGPGTYLVRAHVEDAMGNFESSLADFFRARWSKATEREVAMMVAMANSGNGPYRRADIASAMGVSSSAISMVRRSLMDKGIIESVQHGFLGFTVPGFAEFVREESDL